MFVVSLKRDNLKKIIIVALLAITIIVGVFFMISGKGKNSSDNTAVKNGISMKAGDNNERLAFLSQFGWEVTEDPIEVTEVIIPEEFDSTYEKYNELQKEQNLDLSKYKGMRVKKWTYEIKNYPSFENSDGIIRANLLVYNGVVIGGDICNIELDGFMHTFTFLEEQKSQGETKSANSVSSEPVSDSQSAAESTSAPSLAQEATTG